MHFLMNHPNHELPVIVNGDSRDFAELSMAGYQPIKQGYRKQLEDDYKEIMENFVQELELNEIN